MIHFGYSTDSYDARRRSRLRRKSPSRSIARRWIASSTGFAARSRRFLRRFRPRKSAASPPYELARKNQPVELEAGRKCRCYSLEMLSVEGSEAAVRVHCSAGTYLRSIAHDAGPGARLRSVS